jgi:hypothetical protein
MKLRLCHESTALIEVEELFADNGLIEIPKAYKTKASYVGTVLDVKPPDAPHKDHHFWTDQIPVLKAGRVILSHLGGKKVRDGLYVYNLSAIVAIVTKDAKVGDFTVPMPRCRHCGSAKGTDQNVIMHETNGVVCCPRCGRDVHGKKHDPFAIPDTDPSDEDIHRFAPDISKRRTRGSTVTVL